MIYQFPELYQEQYQHYRDDLYFYTQLAQDYGSPVLELGAGTGRVSLHLGKSGFEVLGLELSPQMLGLGRQRLREAGLEHSVRLEPGDMRTFDLRETYPLIIAPFNALMHLYTLKDQDAAFGCIRRHLKPDGLFAFDLYNPNFVNLEQLTRLDEWADVGGDNSELFIYQSHDHDKQVLTSKYYLDSVDESGYLTRKTAVLTQRYYMRFELERALIQAGFSHLRFFGEFDRSPYSKDAGHLIGLVKP
ncbi:MAG: class I SAM-dependent methyltransferase [Trueperaceae bacterium]|nr:class I SAM-dependent methyltransferase [Trueperaceae bacterium]